MLGVPIKRIAIRDQTSRWGSCSTTGVISYSWRLIFAPPFVLDYIAAHEVAHLVEMNHSPRFWALVERLYPTMGKAKAWLDAHGTGLHRYGEVDDDAKPKSPSTRLRASASHAGV
jgi:predicted metal-dependent hydrolase